tara:strand:- start:338 stop:916 length:579 start_codon:yes stop_codon:yes gene_type:complete
MNLTKIAIAAIVTSSLATSALANETNTMVWNGDAETAGAIGCAFSNRAQGTMRRGQTAATAHIWEVTTPASVTIRSRGRATLTVAPTDSLLVRADGTATNLSVAVDYTSGAGAAVASTIQRRNGVATVAAEQLQLANITTDINLLTRFNIGGTATMGIVTGGVSGGSGDANTLNWLANDVDYKVSHTVTCTQ